MEDVGAAYGNFELDGLICNGAHFVVEAKSVLSNLVCGEDKIALALFLAVENDFITGADDRVVDVEGATALDLWVEGLFSRGTEG